MHQLPPSQYIFPDPIEADPEGHGFICIGADLSPSTLLKPTHMDYFHGSTKMNLSVGGVLNHVALSNQRHINRANPYYEI